MTHFEYADNNSITRLPAGNHELSTSVNKKNGGHDHIPSEVVSRIMAICRRRGVAFEDLSAPTCKKDAETQRSVIVMLQSITSETKAICTFLNINEEVFHTVIRGNRYNLADRIVRNDIRDVITDESRKTRRVDHDPT